MTAGLRALPFVVLLTTGSTFASAGALTCYGVQRGDTAALLARRLTGDAHNRRQPWFQILDPGTAVFIAKSRYALIQPGWHVCMPAEMVRGGFARPLYYLTPPAAVPPQARGLQSWPIDP